MKIINLSGIDTVTRNALLKRPKIESGHISKKIIPILEDVRVNGDEAVAKYTAMFDGVELATSIFKPTELSYELDPKTKQAIDAAFKNIASFHKAQLHAPADVETMPGVRCQQITRPIERVGLYVPGGTATLPSTALMLAVPAMISGCSSITLATPPRPDGNISPEIIYIAKKTGVTHILAAGGAQAIAAMAYGTASIPKVDKIFGPGNQYVTAAKMLLQNSDAMISIDMPAGPSEVLIIADEKANPEFVAADLLSQAEHGSDSQVMLVLTPGSDEHPILEAIHQQLPLLPRRKIAEQALKRSFVIKTNSISQAIDFSNDYAPEHLIINMKNAREILTKIQNAGSIFLGQWTPESAGDYASGTNHTLPTYGFAKMYSGVNVAAFQKHITVQELSKAGLQNIGNIVEILAEAEGLQAHKNAVSIRLKEL